MSTMILSSEQLVEGAQMPLSCVHPEAGGANRSPALSWSGAPSKTSSYAVTCFDPDEPTGVGFVHWLLFDIDPGILSLAGDAGTSDTLPEGAQLGFTDLGRVSLWRACPHSR